MNRDDFRKCIAYGMDRSLQFPASINDYNRQGILIRNNLGVCIRSIRNAMAAGNLPVLGEPLYSFAIDPYNPSEADDCISIGSEDEQCSGSREPCPVLYIHITNVPFIIDKLPLYIRTRVRLSSYARGATRYMDSGSLR